MSVIDDLESGHRYIFIQQFSNLKILFHICVIEKALYFSKGDLSVKIYDNTIKKTSICDSSPTGSSILWKIIVQDPKIPNEEPKPPTWTPSQFQMALP